MPGEGHRDSVSFPRVSRRLTSPAASAWRSSRASGRQSSCGDECAAPAGVPYADGMGSAREMDRLRIEHMASRASVGQGVQIVDDTDIAKKGEPIGWSHPAVSGTLGRMDNCQVLVTTHYVDRVFDWPITSRVYLPQSWAKDGERRVAVFTVRTKDSVSRLRSWAATALSVSGWDTSAPFPGHSTLSPGAHSTSNLSVFPIPSRVPFSLMAYKRCARIRVYRVGYRGTHLSSVGWLIGECPVDGH